MKLITEVVEDVDIFELEEEDGKKTLHLEGVFLQSQVKNRNGRVYPKEILQKEDGVEVSIQINLISLEKLVQNS